MAAYLGYTLRMKTLFRGWPVMVHDTHTRRRRLPVVDVSVLQLVGGFGYTLANAAWSCDEQLLRTKT